MFEIVRLSSGNDARIMSISNEFEPGLGVISHDFLDLFARYPATWLNFGNIEKGDGYFTAYIIRDPVLDTYMVYQANKWHHICFAYSSQESRISYVKDGKVTNINQIEKRIEHLALPEDLLDLIFVGRCPESTKYCSVHSGEFTDINFWNKALNVQEMIAWTNCS